MTRIMHVGVAQVHSRAGEITRNLERMHRIICAAFHQGVEILLFAETVIHGYDASPETLAGAESVAGALAQQLQGWADQYQMTLLAGMWERDGETIYNSHLIVSPGAPVRTQRICLITGMEIAGGIASGPRERTLFSFHDISCALLICADTGLEGIYEELIGQGVEYVFIPTAGGGTRDEFLTEAELATVDGKAKYLVNLPRVFKTDGIVLETRLPFASANALGDDGRSLIHQGHCMILDRHFVLRAQIPGTNVLEHQQDQLAQARLLFV